MASGIDLLLSVLSFFKSSAGSLSLNQSLSVLSEEELGDSYVRGLDRDLDDSSFLGLLLNLLNVQTPLLSIDGVDFSTGSLIASSENLDSVLSSDWKSLDTVFLLEVFAKGRAHQSILDV